MESKEDVLGFEVPVKNQSLASLSLGNTALFHKETHVDQRFEDVPNQRFWNWPIEIQMVPQYVTQITIRTVLHLHLSYN